MSKFYVPLSNESFLLHIFIIMSIRRRQHTRNNLANEETMIYK